MTTFVLVAALLTLPFLFLLGGVLVKLGCYLVGVAMPPLLRASFYGLAASIVSGWVTPVALRFVPMENPLAMVLAASAVSILVGGFFFKLIFDVSWAKGAVIAATQKSLGIVLGTIAVSTALLLI